MSRRRTAMAYEHPRHQTREPQWSVRQQYADDPEKVAPLQMLLQKKEAPVPPTLLNPYEWAFGFKAIGITDQREACAKEAAEQGEGTVPTIGTALLFAAIAARKANVHRQQDPPMQQAVQQWIATISTMLTQEASQRGDMITALLAGYRDTGIALGLIAPANTAPSATPFYKAMIATLLRDDGDAPATADSAPLRTVLTAYVMLQSFDRLRHLFTQQTCDEGACVPNNRQDSNVLAERVRAWLQKRQEALTASSCAGCKAARRYLARGAASLPQQ